MIEIGSTIITAITIGGTTPSKIDWGNDQVWPDGGGGTDYITLSSSSASIGSGSNSSNIYVTASTTAWTVSTSDSSWLTVSKSSGTMARYSAAQNGGAARTGYVYFRINGTTYATFTVSQAEAGAGSDVTADFGTGVTMSRTAGSQTIFPLWDPADADTFGWYPEVRANYIAWLTVESHSTVRFTISVSENYDSGDRWGYVDIYLNGQVVGTLTVRQLGTNPGT